MRKVGKMETKIIIPAPDPLALPAPYWLFLTLLVLTFLLHIIAMNFMFGSGMLAFVALRKSKTRQVFGKIYETIVKKIPVLLAATITLGVAPLLFLQVLYGQFFYTSSLIIAWPWFFVLIMLMLAYYGFYYIAFSNRKNSTPVGWVLIISVVLIFLIGFIYSNNLTLMETPENYAVKYHADPSGMNLNLEDPTLVPRFLHFVLASLAIGGLFVGAIGLFNWEKEREFAEAILNFGGKWFIYSTMLQFLVGSWFLMTLPRESVMLFMGRDPVGSISLIVSIFGSIGAVVLMSSALRKEDPRSGFKMAIWLTAAVVTLMTVIREIVRESYLKTFYISHNFDVDTQWVILILFLLSFAGGVGLWIKMLRVYFSEIAKN